MLPPRLLHLAIDEEGILAAHCIGSPAVDSILRAVRTVEDGSPCVRAALENLTPIHVIARTGLLQSARVSGLPNRESAHPREVRHAPNVVTLFLARGDCYLLRLHKGELCPVTFVSIDYDIAPKLRTTTAPSTHRDPREGPRSALNDGRLLDIVFDRELTPVEQHVAATTMPSVWSRRGGGPVALVREPRPEEVEQCLAFCRMFSDPAGRLQQLASQSAAWAYALSSRSIDREAREDLGNLDDQSAVGVTPFAAIPVLEKNDKRAKQQPEPGNPALAVLSSVSGDSSGTQVSDGLGVAATSHPEKMTNTKEAEVVRSTPRLRN